MANSNILNRPSLKRDVACSVFVSIIHLISSNVQRTAFIQQCYSKFLAIMAQFFVFCAEFVFLLGLVAKLFVQDAYAVNWIWTILQVFKKRCRNGLARPRYVFKRCTVDANFSFGISMDAAVRWALLGLVMVNPLSSRSLTTT